MAKRLIYCLQKNSEVLFSNFREIISFGYPSRGSMFNASYITAVCNEIREKKIVETRIRAKLYYYILLFKPQERVNHV